MLVDKTEPHQRLSQDLVMRRHTGSGRDGPPAISSTPPATYQPEELETAKEPEPTSPRAHPDLETVTQ